MRSRFVLAITLLTLLATACGAAPVTDEAVGARALAYSLTGEEVLTYHTEIDASGTTSVAGAIVTEAAMPTTMSSSMEMSLDTTYRIGDGPEPGTYRIAMTTENVELSSGVVEMGTRKLDLADLPQSDLDAALNAQMPEFVYVIDEKGNVVSVEVEGVAMDLSGLLGGTSTGGFSGGQLFGPQLPETEVTVGDSWTSSSEQEFGEITVATEQTHTILRSEEYNGHETWVIKTEATTDAFTVTWDDVLGMYEAMEGMDQIPGMEDIPASLEMSMHASPSVTTTITWLDPEMGRAVAVETSTDIVMTIEMVGMPGLPGASSMETSSRSHTLMELVD